MIDCRVGEDRRYEERLLRHHPQHHLLLRCPRSDQSEEFDWPEFDERTGSALCYTSGTTGRPKGVL